MRDGRFSITTPEGVRLLLTPAGPVPRAWAWLIDIAIFGGVIYLLSFITILTGSKAARGILFVLGFVLYWGYPVICEVYFGGSTIGKRVLGLKVVRANGLPVSWRESILRNLLLVADFMPMMYATGLVCLLLDKRFRRLGDMVANTQVVYVEKAQTRTKLAPVTPMAAPFPLTPEQQRSLIDLMERENTIPNARLLELASLAEPLTKASEEESLRRLRAIVAGLNQ